MMENQHEKIQIALVDDDALIVELLSGFLSKNERLEVIMKAYDGQELIDTLRTTQEHPQVVLIDMRMKKMNGDEATRIMKEEFPDIKVVALSSFYKESFMGYMLKAGVNAFVPKGISPDLLTEVIFSVYDKGFYFMEEQVEAMRPQIASSVPEPAFTSEGSLTKREIEVLKLLCQQHTTPEIAEKIFVSKRTVETHRNNLLVKTGAKNTAGLIIYAVQKQIFDIEGYSFN